MCMLKSDMPPKSKKKDEEPPFDVNAERQRLEVEFVTSRIKEVRAEVETVVDTNKRLSDELVLRMKLESETTGRLENEVQDKEETLRQQAIQINRLNNQLVENEKAFAKKFETQENAWAQKVNNLDVELRTRKAEIEASQRFLAIRDEMTERINELESSLREAQADKEFEVTETERRHFTDLDRLKKTWMGLFEKKQAVLHSEAKKQLDQLTVQENEMLLREMELLSAEVTRLVEANQALTEQVVAQKKDNSLLEEALALAHRRVVTTRQEAAELKAREEAREKEALGVGQSDAQREREENPSLVTKLQSEVTKLQEHKEKLQNEVTALKKERDEARGDAMESRAQLQHYREEHQALARLQDQGGRLLLSFLDEVRAKAFLDPPRHVDDEESSSSSAKPNALLAGNPEQPFSLETPLSPFTCGLFGMDKEEAEEVRLRFGIRTVEQRDLFLSILLRKLDESMCASCRQSDDPAIGPDVRRLLLFHTSASTSTTTSRFAPAPHQKIVASPRGGFIRVGGPNDEKSAYGVGGNTLNSPRMLNFNPEGGPTEVRSRGVQTEPQAVDLAQLPLKQMTARMTFAAGGTHTSTHPIMGGSISPLAPVKLPPEHKLPSFSTVSSKRSPRTFALKETANSLANHANATDGSTPVSSAEGSQRHTYAPSANNSPGAPQGSSYLPLVGGLSQAGNLKNALSSGAPLGSRGLTGEFVLGGSAVSSVNNGAQTPRSSRSGRR